ncbi:MAG TPA: nitroreductase family protein [Candidatus Paceibacterota bacterium]|nr:nitroreductase family protein [Candidatus Paceibacterota bacterium]
MKTVNNRTTQYDIDDVFLNRYSPRAMSGEPVSQLEIMTLLEAARWAPSASNIQPWRFLYAIRGTADFDLFLSFLMEGNQIWCKNAGAFIIVLSKKNTDDGKPNGTHSFDAGSAWENLALQGANMKLVVHGMAGYNAEPLKKELSIKDEYNVELMIAIGKPGKIEDLPEYLREREQPSQRKGLEEIAFEGKEGAKQL